MWAVLTDTGECDLYASGYDEVLRRYQVSVRFEQSVVVQKGLRNAAHVLAIAVARERPHEAERVGAEGVRAVGHVSGYFSREILDCARDVDRQIGRALQRVRVELVVIVANDHFLGEKMYHGQS